MVHQKRLAVPRTWPIPRKTFVWSMATRPGPHAKERSMPLGLYLRDVLGLVETRRELRRILQAGQVQVNGSPVKDDRFPVGFFDVLAIPALGSHYVVVPDARGRLRLRGITPEQARTKLSRVEGKTVVKGGKIQLHLFEGTNLLAGPEIGPGDGLVLSLPDRKVVRHYPRARGARVFVAGGGRSGAMGTLEEVRSMHGSAPNIIRVSEGRESGFETIEDYVFVIGPSEEAVLKGGADGN